MITLIISCHVLSLPLAIVERHHMIASSLTVNKGSSRIHFFSIQVTYLPLCISLQTLPELRLM